MTWTDDRIEDALRVLIERLGKYPTDMQIRASEFSGLSTALSRSSDKHSGWRRRLGAGSRVQWNDSLIETELRELVSVFQRMPSAAEMRKCGKNALACAISRHPLKFRGWADKLWLRVKNSATERSYKMEVWVANRLRALGYDVEMTSTKCGHDLLVDNTVRVEVKMAQQYVSEVHGVAAHIFCFGTDPTNRTIDVSVLVCVDAQDNPEKTYVIPAAFCLQQSISITGSHRWTPFLEAWHLVGQPYEAN